MAGEPLRRQRRTTALRRELGLHGLEQLAVEDRLMLAAMDFAPR